MNIYSYKEKVNQFDNELALAKNDIISRINDCKHFSNLDKKYLIEKVREITISPNLLGWKDLIGGIYGINTYNDHDRFDFYFNKLEQFVEDELGFGRLISAFRNYGALSCLMDSEYVFIEGDIVITDPCYTTNSWCNGFDPYSLPLCRDTIYGDWSCTTYNKEEKEDREIGQFCADAGMVCVDTLDNILVRKPTFLEEYPEWCRTIIPNFKGKVKIEVVCVNKEKDEEQFDIFNYEVRIVGDGCDKKTGKSYNFYTTQTGL